MDQIKKDFLIALSCAINKKELAIDIDEEQIYILAVYHSLTSLLATVFPGKEPWTMSRRKVFFADVNMDKERKKILHFMEENGIWHMPLKGIILKDLYPIKASREMADNDILFDKCFTGVVHDYMVGQGYEDKSYLEGHVDEYIRKPCFNFEMHRALYHTNNRKLHDYYKDVKDRLIKDEDNNYGYHFTDEDFYVFMVSHAYRHYKDGGTGIRSLLDIYVYNKEKNLDYAYIEQELRKIDVFEYEKRMRPLAEKIFCGEEYVLTEEEEQILEYYFDSGTFGTQEHNDENALLRMTGESEFTEEAKKKYWIKRIIDMDWYKEHMPLLYKTIVLIPFHVLFRCVRGLTKLDKLKEEYRRIQRK